jgi:trehalose 6-phosphate synthase/phosphatase
MCLDRPLQCRNLAGLGLFSAFSAHIFYTLNRVFHLPLQPLPLYTTESSYPWYNTQSPLAISVPPLTIDDDDTTPIMPQEQNTFQYRYAVWRAGVFHRWEQRSDGPTNDDVDMADNEDQIAASGDVLYHRLPLKLLTNRETYVVNDVLGVVTAPADIDRLRIPSQTSSTTISSLHHRENSSSGGHLRSQGSLMSSGSVQNTAQTSRASKKKVGFAPVPPPYHKKTLLNKQTVHLNATDGLVVVSVFLPVHLHRTDDGEWTAEWDYEMLLSMQTHLRVTRIGVVKWRGWHGNRGPAGSPEAGVPESERHKVEACLAPFSCVPVWIEPTTVFGEM